MTLALWLIGIVAVAFALRVAYLLGYNDATERLPARDERGRFKRCEHKTFAGLE